MRVDVYYCTGRRIVLTCRATRPSALFGVTANQIRKAGVKGSNPFVGCFPASLDDLGSDATGRIRARADRDLGRQRQADSWPQSFVLSYAVLCRATDGDCPPLRHRKTAPGEEVDPGNGAPYDDPTRPGDLAGHGHLEGLG